MRYFVHVYRTVRSKFLIEAEDPKQAMELADAELHVANDRLAYEYFPPSISPEQEAMRIAQLDPGFHLATEDAEDTTAYLIDIVGDEGFERSENFEGDGTPYDSERQKKLPVSSRERDTILAALRLWQHTQEDSITFVNGAEDMMDEIIEIANNGGTVEPLTPGEVDALCERINI